MIMEPTGYEKLTTRGEPYSFHVVDNAIIDDNSVVILSTVSAQACNFSEGDIVFVKSKNKDTVLIVLTNDDLDCGIAGVSPSVRDNLIVRQGDMVIVQSCPVIQGVSQKTVFLSKTNLKQVQSISLLPAKECGKVLSTSLFDLYLAPYFYEEYRPVMQGDIFTVHGGSGTEMTFIVDRVWPGDYGIVIQETMIQCKEPCRREMGCGLKAWVEAKLHNGYRRLGFGGQ
jgi:transitional endoplasmic reticulum ATPase